jgi:hypothetical protein
MNFDETPIPFEYLDCHTYNLKGKKTVSVKTDRSGWSKRQATLILYVFADGIPRIDPDLIFHGTATESGGRLEALEGDKYAKGVSVHFNKSAYNNEELTERWLDEKLIPLIRPINQPHQPFLLSFDCAAFHKTPPLLRKMKDNDITPALVPPGCTGILQPLDTHINKPFKEYLQDATEEYMDRREDETGTEAEKWSVSDKRIMVTHVVADAWKRFCTEKQAVVCKAFQDVGLFLPVDGSQDHLLSIKGFGPDELQIGDYNQRDDEIETYHELPKIAENEEYELACETSEYKGLLWWGRRCCAW